MRIAIIGTGNIGGALGTAWAAKGHEVSYGVRDVADPGTLAAVAKAGGKTRAATVAGAVRDAEVVTIAVPFAAVASVIESAGSLAGKVVIDCTNAVGVPLPAGVNSAAELVAKLATGARVVKSFNAQGAENIAEPRYGNEAASNFYCGDDADAKNIVRALITDIGFDPIDVGALANARHVESATFLWFAASKSLGTRSLGFRILRAPV